jgi:ATP-dependent DNA ligase
MSALPAPGLPDPERAARYSFEPKMDGFRCLAFRTRGDKALLQSRQERSLSSFFPEIVAGLVEQLPIGTVVDGGLVICRDGRLDFTALQRRFHPSSVHAARRGVLAPASFVVFDLLALDGQDLRGMPYRTRRKRLRRLLEGARAPMALMPMTRDLVGAKAWMSQHTAAGIEGVVVKDRGHGYRPGRRSWMKVRTRTTAEAIVGAFSAR